MSASKDTPYNYGGLYGQQAQAPSNNPFDNFIAHLEGETNPNYLRYILFVLEKTSMAPQRDLYTVIRKNLEERYHMEEIDPWKPSK